MVNACNVHCIHWTPALSFSYSRRERKSAENLGLCVQYCTKWVQSYDPLFYVETALGGGLHVSDPQIWIADSGKRVYKIWNLVYKIVQNKYKIMIYFSLSKSVLGGAGDMHFLVPLVIQPLDTRNRQFLFIRFYFIHFSRFNSISISLFWENTGSASEN